MLLVKVLVMLAPLASFKVVWAAPIVVSAQSAKLPARLVLVLPYLVLLEGFKTPLGRPTASNVFMATTRARTVQQVACPVPLGRTPIVLGTVFALVVQLASLQPPLVSRCAHPAQQDAFNPALASRFVHCALSARPLPALERKYVPAASQGTFLTPQANSNVLNARRVRFRINRVWLNAIYAELEVILTLMGRQCVSCVKLANLLTPMGLPLARCAQQDRPSTAKAKASAICVL
mmetsp:Transcript_49517/g.97069  ORF Transcript_49517/g.97069 Transcript_49517/m.97069 type:complete len:234 (+) Transcript_49517:2550-3251(+)